VVDTFFSLKERESKALEEEIKVKSLALKKRKR